ncbi:NAD(+) synthase [uncultured Limimaricola sp.]|uniref:NAD(+) synthase n=1 Tax=uncultured Limimaricola sp. TaxID=2211667 RepID=UPI0030F82D02
MKHLDIDTTKAIREISDYLEDLVRRQHTDGVILGLSGGLDSAVLAALAVTALGPDRVRVLYLFDRDSDPQIAQNARLMAQILRLPLEEIDITGDMKRRGVYKPLFPKVLRLSKTVARISTRMFRRICGMSPFMATLRVGRGETLRPWYKQALFDHTIKQLDWGFSQRHLFRRQAIETRARQQNLSIIGAANLSECEVGWFVHGGIDDLPVQPMTGLYKTQVRQLAAALNLPATVRHQLPSPDMAKGVSDEFGIGHDYSVIDIVIDALAQGRTAAEIAAEGVEKVEIEDIRRLMELSDWKRRSPHEVPPVSGAFGSPLRRDASPPSRRRMA